MSIARFTPTQGKRIGYAIQDFEAHGRNRGIQDDSRPHTRAVASFDLARITAVTSSFNSTTWVYQFTFQSNATASGYNSFEWNGTNPSMLQGSPGSLGVAVGTDGSVTGTSCFVKPIGTTGWFPVAWDAINARWIFALPNSAGA